MKSIFKKIVASLLPLLMLSCTTASNDDQLPNIPNQPTERNIGTLYVINQTDVNLLVTTASGASYQLVKSEARYISSGGKSVTIHVIQKDKTKLDVGGLVIDTEKCTEVRIVSASLTDGIISYENR